MAVQPRADWWRANQTALMNEVAAVRSALEQHAGQPSSRTMCRVDTEVVSALEIVCRRFGLSSFERKILVMCAAVELEAGFAALCAVAQGDPASAYPTFGLALAAFDDAHWSALTIGSPLRAWALIDVSTERGLTRSPLRINESVLHELAGVSELDAYLLPYAELLEAAGDLVPSQAKLAEQIAAVWNPEGGMAPRTVVRLGGTDAQAKRAAAARVFANLSLAGCAIDGTRLPRDPGELHQIARAWNRETVLHGAGLYIDAQTAEDVQERSTLGAFVERLAGPVIVGCNHPVEGLRRAVCSFDVGNPSRSEQRALWNGVLAGIDGDAARTADQLVAQFDVSASAIRSAAMLASCETGSDASARVWSAARRGSRRGLEAIAQRLEACSGWGDLVLPSLQREALRDLVAHARNRTRVYEDWGMGPAAGRGLGIAALFHGPSGTGKTLAAEVIGHDLGLDVYRIDLSQLVSKFIGETEKNLRRVFDAAEEGGAILLFDECDAIFGKRGEVQYGHDRYANIEISYLLQRMESYRGIAILTTNMRNAIDAAFMRRLRFVVPFPFPDYEQRMAIWERAFPPSVPTAGLDLAKAARLNVSGANIRNIALYAAFLAADAGTPVGMSHVLRAARAECVKIERAPTDLEIGGWT